MRRSLLAAVVALACCATAARADDLPTAADVRAAAERGLASLEKRGVAWITERKCVSCHTVAFTLWSHNEARRRGLAVDADKLAGWTRFALDDTLKRGSGGSGSSTLAQLLLSRDPATKAEEYEKLQALLLERQSPDGSFPFDGQGGRFPADVSTSWALLALASRDAPADADPKASEAWAKGRDRAREWLKAADGSDSTEALQLRLLVAVRFGDAAAADRSRKELLARQNEDGGWAYRKGVRESDAFATGQALYALSQAGGAAGDAAIRRGQKFLLEAQREDGAWAVATRNVHEWPATEERLKKTDVIYGYWGSGWATIGLLSTLPDASKPETPARE